jgi:hypothetical protein
VADVKVEEFPQPEAGVIGVDVLEPAIDELMQAGNESSFRQLRSICLRREERQAY